MTSDPAIASQKASIIAQLNQAALNTAVTELATLAVAHDALKAEVETLRAEKAALEKQVAALTIPPASQPQ